MTPNVYSGTELMIGKECRKRPMFIIITVAAKVTNRALRSCKWGVVKGCTCGEGWTEQMTRCWPARYSMPHTSYSVNSWGTTRVWLSPSLAAFWGPHSWSFLWSWSRFRPVRYWVQFPSTAEASPGLPSAHQHPQHLTPGNSASVLCILFHFSHS